MLGAVIYVDEYNAVAIVLRVDAVALRMLFNKNN
jgi:hypothetical protein